MIKIYPNKILKTPCSNITEENFNNSKEYYNSVINKMKFVLEKMGGIGLQANQIGESISLFIMKRPNSTTPTIIINPEIIKYDEIKKAKNKEGCLSFPEIYFNVERNTEIVVSYKDENFEIIEEELSGREAIVFQHELDHLLGITMYDHQSVNEKAYYKTKIRGLIKKYKTYEIRIERFLERQKR